MANNEFLITNIVSNEAMNELKKLQSELETVTTLYANLAKEIAKDSGSNPKTFDELAQKARNYESSLEQLNKASDEMTGIQRKQLSVLKQVSEQLGNMSSLGKLNTVMGQFVKNIQAVNEMLEKLASVSQQASDTQNQAATGTQQAATTMQQASQQLKQAELNYQSITKAIEEYNNDVVKLAEANAANRLEMSSLSADMKKVNTEYKNGGISLEEYKSKTAALKLEYDKPKASVQQNDALIRNHATAIVSTSGSYYEMNAAMLELQKRYKALSDADRNSQFGQNLVKQANEINAKLKEIDAQFGNYQRNVGNYASGWNGLNVSIQQIGRELPSLAVGLNTFFLAISNNLPMLADELARAKNEYNALKAAGQAATPVWKQVVSSLLSWQTALTVGITLLTLFGKDVIEWVGNLFKAKKGTDALKESQEALNTVQREGSKNAQNEIVQLKVLYNATQDTNRSMDERKKAVDELQRQYPDYFGNLSQESVLAGNAKNAYDALAKSIVASARARAAQDKMVENAKEILGLEEKMAAATAKRDQAQEKANLAISRYNELAHEITDDMSELERTTAEAANRPLKDNMDAANARVMALNNEIDEYKNGIERLEKLNESLGGSIDIDALLSGGESAGDSNDYASYIKKITQDLNKTRIELLQEGREKEIAEINADYAERMAAITGNTQEEIELRENLEELKGRAIQEVNEKYDKELLEIERKNLENRLASIGENSQQELDERLKIQLELNEMIRDAEVQAAEKEGLDTTAIIDKYEKMKNDIVMENLEERFGLIERSSDREIKEYELRAMQEKAVLEQQWKDGLINQTEYEQGIYDIGVKYSRLRLQTLIDEAKAQLQLSGLSEEQQREIERRIARLQSQLNGLGSGNSQADTKAIEQFQEALRNMQSTAEDSLGDTADLFKPMQQVMLGIAETAKKMGKDINDITFEDFWNNLDPKGRASLILQGFADIANGITSIMSSIFDSRIEALEEEQEANEEAYEQEVERIESLQESGAISTEEAEARKRAAEDRTKVKEEEIAKKKAELEQKQARWDKANSIIQAGIATALAVTKALPNFVLAALVGAMGAAQIAVIAAQQIPKYAKGTSDHKGGLAIVGDGGKREGVITDNGVYVTPDRPTLVDLPKHAQVIPDIRTLTSLEGIVSDFGRLDKRMREERDAGVMINLETDNSGLEQRVDANTAQLRKIEKMLKRHRRDAGFNWIARRV